jgi:hypothetical protein
MPPADIAVKIADALGVSVEYLATGREVHDEKAFIQYNHTIRSIIQISSELGERNNEILLGVAKVLKKQMEKQPNLGGDKPGSPA